MFQNHHLDMGSIVPLDNFLFPHYLCVEFPLYVIPV